MVDTWREGARSLDPLDICPGCGAPACVFASDFKKFGRQSVRACVACRTVFVNGKKQAQLEVPALRPRKEG